MAKKQESKKVLANLVGGVQQQEIQDDSANESFDEQIHDVANEQ